jgi:hypothetical protein
MKQPSRSARSVGSSASAVRGVVVLLFALTATSSHPQAWAQTTDSESKRQESRLLNDGRDKNGASETSTQESRSEKYEKAIALSTVVLAAVTALLALFTGGLWLATYRLGRDAKQTAARQTADTQNSLRIAAESGAALKEVAEATKNNALLMSGMLRKQMRAYIAVDIGSTTYQDENARFDSAPVLINTGFTPALEVSYRAQAAVLSTNLSSDFEFSAAGPLYGNDASLSPRQQFIIHAMVDHRFSDAEVEEIKKGAVKRLFVWGTVTYKDVYGESWMTKFCHNFVFVPNADGRWRPLGFYYARHNSTT